MDDRSLDKYKVVKGLNDRNSVFLVTDSSGRLWVKKIIEEESVKIYERMRNVYNPNIAGIREMYNCDMGTVVIEELIDGETVQEAVDRGKKFSLYEVKSIMCQLCDGVRCLHNNGIIHRDVSANNVIINSDGNAKLIDLGISRIKSKEKRSDTYLMGTAGFAAPEQFGFRQTDERSDVFSMGVLMNVMLTGNLPVDEPYDGKFEYRRIIKKCLEMEPHKRYKSVTELKKVLMGLTTEKDNAVCRFFKELPGCRSRKWWKTTLAAAFCVLLLLSVIVDLWILSDSRPGDVVWFSVYIVLDLIVPYLIACNYKYYAERIPVVRVLPDAVRAVLCLGLGAAVMAFVFYIFAWVLIDFL